LLCRCGLPRPRQSGTPEALRWRSSPNLILSGLGCLAIWGQNRTHTRAEPKGSAHRRQVLRVSVCVSNEFILCVRWVFWCVRARARAQVAAPPYAEHSPCALAFSVGQTFWGCEKHATSDLQGPHRATMRGRWSSSITMGSRAADFAESGSDVGDDAERELLLAVLRG